MRILVTGAAGFIGYHVCKRLLVTGHDVYGIDNLNDYYDKSLKKARLANLIDYSNFTFCCYDITDQDSIDSWFDNNRPEIVIHLAAEVGVRNSLKNPQAYVNTNIVGFLNILEGCKRNEVKHLIYASSSSVYGGNDLIPFSEEHNVDRPCSLYGATKKANELMAHTYSHLHFLQTTGLRFFTVYGPWGRPDMSYFLFTKAILENKPIDVFNHGQMKRDFTYIDDIVDGVIAILNRKRLPLYSVYNIGNNQVVWLDHFIELIEDGLGKKAVKNMMSMQGGDVIATYANIDKIAKDTGFRPSVSLEEGIKRFLKWYKDFYTV